MNYNPKVLSLIFVLSFSFSNIFIINKSYAAISKEVVKVKKDKKKPELKIIKKDKLLNFLGSTALGKFLTSNSLAVTTVAVGIAGFTAANSSGGSDDSATSDATPSLNQESNANTDPVTALSFETQEYKNDWGLGNMNASSAYAYLTNQGLAVAGEGVDVIISDDYVYRDHNEFQAQMSIYDKSSGHTPGSHGTHVGGTVAAIKDDRGMHGVAYNANIISMEVYGQSVSSFDERRHIYDLGNMAETLNKNGQTAIVNTSWGPFYDDVNTPASTQEEWIANDPYYRNWVQLYNNHDILVVNTTGNNGATWQDSIGNSYDVINPEPYSFYANRPEIKGKLIATFAVDKYNKNFLNPCGEAAARCIGASGIDILSAGYANKSNPWMDIPYFLNKNNELNQALKFALDPAPNGSKLLNDVNANPIDTTNLLRDQNADLINVYDAQQKKHYYLRFEGSYIEIYSFDGLTMSFAMDGSPTVLDELWNKSPIDFSKEKEFYLSEAGTSMAAPHVTGAAAVIEGAWTYLMAKDIADILLVNAKPSYETSSGGVSFNVNEASSEDRDIRCGGDIMLAGVIRKLSCRYGQGILDLYKAVQAFGDKEITLADSVANISALSKYTADNSSISLNNNISISDKNLSFINDAVYFDYFGRHYKMDTTSMVQTKSNVSSLTRKLFAEKGNEPIRINNGSTALSFQVKKTKENNMEALPDPAFKFSIFNDDKNAKFSYAAGFNQTDNVLNNRSQSQFYKNSKASIIAEEESDKYLDFVNPNNSFDNIKKLQSLSFKAGSHINQNISLSFASSEFYDEEDRRTNLHRVSFNFYDKQKNSELSLDFSDLREKEGNFLGSSSSGALSLGDENDTIYTRINYAKTLPKGFEFLASYTEGKSKLEGDEYGMFQAFDEIKMRGFLVGLTKSNILDGKIGIIVSQPLQIYDGAAYVNYATGRDEEKIFRASKKINLKSIKKQNDFEIFWGKNIDKNKISKLELNFIYKNNDLLAQNQQDSYIASFTYGVEF